MKIILDVHYTGNQAVVAGVQFLHWSDGKPLRTATVTTPVPFHYVPGQFFKRELPCLLKLLREKRPRFKTIIIDGYVHLQPPAEKGLGAQLAAALPYPAAIVGVAKNAFKQANRFVPVYRGLSNKPLFVSSLGLSMRDAAQRIADMNGKFRIPALIKWADRLSRGNV